MARPGGAPAALEDEGAEGQDGGEDGWAPSVHAGQTTARRIAVQMEAGQGFGATSLPRFGRPSDLEGEISRLAQTVKQPGAWTYPSKRSSGAC